MKRSKAMKFESTPRIDMIIDLQYGSTGKGLLAGLLAETYEHDVVVTCNMPNAGHTYIDSRERKMIHKVLPNGIVSPNLKYVLIGPGSVFSISRLMEEKLAAQSIGYLNNVEILVHENATILRKRHSDEENKSQGTKSIASTKQGAMAATVEKMYRDSAQPIVVKQYADLFPDFRMVGPDEWIHIISNAKRVLAEGSQGFSLGINQRFYPYCTSRECTPYRMASDMGLPNVPLNTWGTLRTYPIRVGNTAHGHSGGCYDDQHEVSWDELGIQPEFTTVTGRERRVFTFSMAQLEEALWHCRPKRLFLNFCNYMDEPCLGRLVERIEGISRKYGCQIDLFGYGPTYHDVRRAK
jgi:adenylosuccinate synthase